MRFTNRKIKKYPNHIVTNANDYGMCEKVIESAIKLDVPELKWNIVYPDGSTRFVHVKRHDNAL